MPEIHRYGRYIAKAKPSTYKKSVLLVFNNSSLQKGIVMWNEVLLYGACYNLLLINARARYSQRPYG